MTDVDRAKILLTLAGRHEELLTELDSLEKQVEIALTTTRLPSLAAAPVAIAVVKAA